MDADGIDRATSHLPVGTATLMLTDIEGLARLADGIPEAVNAAVSRHDELLDEAISRHGGVRRLDQAHQGVVVAFTRASDAVAAALDIQRACHRERWPDGARVKPRIALQTAHAQWRDEGDRFGRAISRCARLRAVAHGGQVVLSRATRDLVLDRLPEHAELTDLGVHRLCDLGRPEHVFGLGHPDLPVEYPPLRSLDTMPNNLPGQLTGFVGRRAELRQIADPLGRMRLLTLTGAGGCGKTRLALQAAADTIDRYPDGVWWVELARLEDTALVPAAVLGALGLREVAGCALLDTLAGHLRERCALIVLDNCEHLLAACAQLADVLLRGCPSLTILATSRAPLGVPGEVTWQVPSMSLPSLPIRPPGGPIEALRQSDAVSLFIDRATEVRPNFAITPATLSAVAQICHDLDGIPLAIELAAARVRMLAPEQIAHALSDRFRLLTGGARTVLPRHQTLRASLDWSHELLRNGERTLLRRLSVFAGGWTLDAAEQVCLSEGHDVLNLLTGLVDKCLVNADDQGSQTRYGLLETVRQYAAARLADAGETDGLRDRHLAYQLTLAMAADAQVLDAERGDSVANSLGAELPNLRAALEWAAATDPTAALQLADVLTLFWVYTGRYQQGDAAHARALDAAGAEPALLRGRVLSGRGMLGVFGGAYEAAHGWAQAALHIGESCGDLRTQGRAYLTLGLMASYQDPAAGRSLLERSVQRATQAGDGWCRISASQVLATTWIWQDEFSLARPILDDAYATAMRLRYRIAFAYHWFCLGREAVVRGQPDAARELLARAVAASGVDEPFTYGFANSFLAWVHLACGDTNLAYSIAGTTLRRVLESGAGPPLGVAHHVLGMIELVLGELPAAREHLETAIDVDRRLGFAYWLTWHLAILGTVERVDGNLDTAHRRAFEALEVAQRLGSSWMQATAERLLSRLALAAGQATDAERYVHDGLGRLLAKGFAWDIPECLDILAAIAGAQESFEEAARLLGAAAAGRERLGIVRLPPEAQFWISIESAAREALGPEGYQAAFAAGAALDTDQAVAYVRRARGERKRPSCGWDSLTPTELDVVRHVAAGLTNRQISEQMFISHGTVKTHLSHVFTKLGTTSRSRLAADAIRHRLDPSPATDVAER